MKSRRDLKISVSRNNRDIYDIWRAIQSVDPHPSSTVIKWIRERYAQEWKNRGKPVLSPPQQTIIKSEYIKRENSPSEIQQQKERLEKERLENEKKERERKANYDAAVAFRNK